MNERSVVAGLLSGRLTPRDTRIVDPRLFVDETLMRCFFVVETLVFGGYAPKLGRVLFGFEIMGWPSDGIPELIDDLMREG